MNVVVSERAFEDAIEAALLQRERRGRQKPAFLRRYTVRRILEARLRGLRQDTMLNPARRAGLRPGDAAP